MGTYYIVIICYFLTKIKLPITIFELLKAERTQSTLVPRLQNP